MPKKWIHIHIKDKKNLKALKEAICVSRKKNSTVKDFDVFKKHIGFELENLRVCIWTE